MTTNISRQLTTGALALAGTVAAFSFAGAAQAASVFTITGTATIGAWGTANPVLTPLNVTFASGDGQFTGATAANVTIPGPFTLTGTGVGLSTNFGVPGTLPNYTTITTGAGNVIANITPLVAVGTNVTFPTATTTYVVSGSAIFDEPTGPDLAGTFTATFLRAGTTQLYTLVFTKTDIPVEVPEPSAILGILAVAGAGAFARRKS
jgi:hypothetical protein